MKAKREQFYLLQNESAGFCGNSPYWWRVNGSGYTDSVDDAERFTYEKCREIIRSTRGSHRWNPWKVEDVLNASRLVCDIQKLRPAPSQKPENSKAGAV